MSGTRQPFYDLIPADAVHLIPEHTQMVITEMVEIEAGGVLDIQGKLVVMV